MKSLNISSNFLGNLRKQENGIGNVAVKLDGVTKFEAHDPALFDRLVAYCSDQEFEVVRVPKRLTISGALVS